MHHIDTATYKPPVRQARMKSKVQFQGLHTVRHYQKSGALLGRRAACRTEKVRGSEEPVPQADAN